MTAAPFDPKAEHGLIGAALVNPSAVLAGPEARAVRPEHFHDLRLAKAWRALLLLHDRGELADPWTVAQALGPEDGGDALEIELAQAMASCDTTLRAPAYAGQVLRDAARRRAQAIARELHLLGDNPNGRDALEIAHAAQRLVASLEDVAPPPAREVWTPAQLCDLPLAPTPWLLDRWLLDGGLALLVGDAGSGKTFVALDLALAVNTGGQAWGRRAQQGGVLYLGNDTPRSTFQRRLVALCQGRGIPPPRDRFELDLSALDLFDPAATRILRDAVERASARLIVVDSLYSYLGAADENASGDMGRVFGHLREVCAHTGAAALVLHHTNKATLMAPADRARGSTVMRGAVDSMLMTTAKGRGADLLRSLISVKQREAEDPPPLTFSLEVGAEGRGLVLAFGAASESDVAADLASLARGLMLEALRADPTPRTRRELQEILAAQRLTVSSRVLDTACAELARTPGVTVAQQGRARAYSWAPK